MVRGVDATDPSSNPPFFEQYSKSENKGHNGHLLVEIMCLTGRFRCRVRGEDSIFTLSAKKMLLFSLSEHTNKGHSLFNQNTLIALYVRDLQK